MYLVYKMFLKKRHTFALISRKFVSKLMELIVL